MPKKRDRHQNPQPFIADENASVASKKRSKLPKQHQTDEELISSGMSSKILKEALAQQREIQDEAEPRNANGNNNSFVFTEAFAEAEEAEEDEIDDFGGFSETRSLFDSYDVSVIFFKKLFGLYCLVIENLSEMLDFEFEVFIWSESENSLGSEIQACIFLPTLWLYRIF